MESDKRIETIGRSTKYYPTSKVSESTKETVEFYKSVADYILSVAHGAPYNDVEDTKRNLLFANGDIPDEYFNYIIKPYQNMKDTENPYPKEMKKFDLITPIRERMISEFIRLQKTFTVYVADPDITASISPSVKNEIKNQISQIVINMFNEGGFDTGMPSKDTVDLTSIKEQVTDKWKLEKGLEYSKRVKYLEYVLDCEAKYIQAFMYYWATEKVVTYRTVRGTQIIFDVINPVEYWRIKGNLTNYIEDDPAGVRRGYMAIPDLDIRFKGYYSDEELSDIKDLLQAKLEGISTSSPYLNGSIVNEALKYLGVSYNTLNNDSATIPQPNVDQVAYDHIWYKGYREVQILTYLSQSGEVEKMTVEPSYELREDLGDINLEKHWTLSVYEQYVVYGANSYKVYTKPRLVNPQRELVTNENIVKAPYNGIYGVLEGLSLNPIPKRCAPWNTLFRIFKYRMEIAVADYTENIPVIPESLLQDSEHTTLKTRLATLKRDRKLIVNDEDLNPNAYQYLKSMAVSSGGEYIRLLEELCDGLRRQCLDAANMNEQRYGDIGDRAGKATTEYAISNSSLASILSLTVFNNFMQKDYAATIDYSKIAWVSGITGSYANPDGTTEHITVDGLDHYCSNIGIRFLNSAVEWEKIQQYKNLAISYANSGAQELSIIAIDGESSYEIKNGIVKAIEKQQQLAREKEEADRQNQILISENQLKAQREAQQYNSDIQTFLEEQKFRREQLSAIVKLYVATKDDKYANEIDSNLDSQESALKQMELNLKQKEIDNKQVNENRKLDIAAQQVAVAKEAAKNKPTTSK